MRINIIIISIITFLSTSGTRTCCDRFPSYASKAGFRIHLMQVLRHILPVGLRNVEEKRSSLSLMLIDLDAFCELSQTLDESHCK